MPDSPRVAVFDLGKVLLDFDYGIAARRLGRSCDVPWSEIQRGIDQSPLLNDYERNAVTTEGFFQEIRRISGFAGKFEEFREAFGDVFAAIEPMVSLLRRLRSRRVPAFVFSNTNELAVAHIRARFPFFSEFDGYILSYEQRCLKPEPAIYEAVEQATGRTGGGLGYIDDREENVATARQRGWRAIWHRTPEETIPAVEAWFGLERQD